MRFLRTRSGPAGIEFQWCMARMATPDTLWRLLTSNAISTDAMRPPTKLSFDFAMQVSGTLPETASAGDLPKLNQALEFLFADLRHASELFHQPGDDGRAGAAAALGAMSRFVMLFERPLAESLQAPMLRLHAALSALNGNKVEPIVKPVARRGRSDSSAARLALKGASAGTVRRLLDIGIARPDAFRAVSNQLKKIGVRPERGPGDITDTTIRHWCNTVAADVSRTGAAATVHDSMFTAEENARFAAMPRDEAQAFALASLADFIQLNFPEIVGRPKPT
jgi:hypothetical protein